jgi:penicillin-binding protein 1B
VKFAEMVGYNEVADLAKRAGLETAKATPALALGSYEATPLEVANAYTIFSNGGVFVKRSFVREIRTESGGLIDESKLSTSEVLDPRISYMVVNLLEEVLRSGTGAGARGRGFLLPAAGKTGTSRDAWFAGFTSKLLCVVWVGYDNNEELPLEGAKAALPIWVEFMKRAHRYREYRGVQEFEPPDGVAMVDIDPATGQLATSGCPNPRQEVFIAGTQPVELCRMHGGSGRTQIASWDTPAPETPREARAANEQAAAAPRKSKAKTVPPTGSEDTAKQEKPAAPKQSLWDKIRSIFK